MREIKTTVYTFDGLNDSAKETAREWYREHALDYDWWEFVYEDAERVGLKIKEFDLDRGSYVKAEFTSSAEETAHKIEKEHGEACETYKTAKEYLKERDRVVDQWGRDKNGDFINEGGLDESLDALDSDFLHDLQEDYRIILEKEIEWLMSDGCVDDNMTANGYEFTADGKRA